MRLAKLARGATVLGLLALHAVAGCDYERTSYTRTPARPRPTQGSPTAGGGAMSGETSPGTSTGSCTTSCIADSTSDIAPDERARAAAAMEPTFKELRACLNRVGGQKISPAALLRFEAPGPVTSLRYDMGGYEELGCVQDVKKRSVEVTLSRTGGLRCEYRCD